MRRLSPFFSPLAVVLAAVAAGILPARADAPPPVVIVVDGSGSVWGNFEGNKDVKFYSAQAALTQSLSTAGPQSRIGLVSFGHRRKGDCSDVELIVAPEAGPIERLTVPIAKLNPRGKGPVTQALREAAKAIGLGSPGTIILLSDGTDNCQQDPCAAAADIARSNPQLPIHLIGLGLDKVDAQRMSCVPKATGGKFYDTHDATSLGIAVNDALKLAKLDAGSAPEVKAQPQAAPPVAPPAGTDEGPPAVRLSAALAPNGPPVAAAMTWRVAKEGAPETAVLVRSAAELTEALPEGPYVVDVTYGLASARQTVEVHSKGTTAARLALNAGTLKLSARGAKGTEVLAEPLVTIAAAPASSNDKEAKVNADALWIGRDPEAELIVPAGSYQVRLDDGLAHRETSVAVAPGGRTTADIALATGRLEIIAVANDGGTNLDQVTYVITRDDPDAPQGRREVARSAAPRPDFTLAAGTYYVAARAGAAEVRERIAISSGDVVKRTLVMGLARLSLSVVLDAAVVPASQSVTWAILALDAETPREVARSTSAAPELLLGRGRHRIEAQLGTTGIKAVTEIDVQPGKDMKIAMKLDAAQLTVKPAAGAASESGGAWEVRDSGGRILLRSGRGEAKTTNLAPGRYIIRSDKGSGRAERPIDLKTGERRTIDLTVE